MTELSDDAKELVKVASACMHAGLSRSDAAQEMREKSAQLGWTEERLLAAMNEMVVAGGVILEDAAIVATMAMDCQSRGMSPPDAVTEVRTKLQGAGWTDDRIHRAEQGFIGAMRP